MSGPIRKKSYSVEFKLQVVSKTETSSIRAAASLVVSLTQFYGYTTCTLSDATSTMIVA